MKIELQVKPNSKESSLIKTDSGYLVKLHSRAIEGRANAELVTLLSSHFDIPKSCIHILKGVKGRIKVVEIDNED